MSDLVGYTSGVATVAATVIAAGAMWQTKRNGDRNERALIDERRFDFELRVLSDLAEAHDGGRMVASYERRMRTLASLLPINLVPITRAAAGLPSSDAEVSRMKERKEADAAYKPFADVEVRREVTDEILAAIRRRLRDRSAPTRRRKLWRRD